jgi:hypothetical protein
MLTLGLDRLLRPDATAYAQTLAQLAEADEDEELHRDLEADAAPTPRS